MKRAALGVLLISLVAGSTAFAGTYLPPSFYDRNNGAHNDRGHEQHRPDNRSDSRGGHYNDHRDDRGSNGTPRDDHRGDGGRDDPRSVNDRHWNDGRRY